jgi:multidrug efflux system outer membrane protein
MSLRYRWFFRWGAICFLPSLLGCNLLADRLEPDLEVPATYRGAPGGLSSNVVSVDAWRLFRSAELTTLTEQALSSNLNIAQAAARIIEADAQIRVAGAALLPGLQGTASSTRSYSPSSVGGAGDLTVHQAMLNASYELDLWGRNRALLRSAELSASASRFDREVIALSTVVSVADTYFLVLEAEDRIRIAQKNIAGATKLLTIVEDRSHQGIASLLDVAQQASVVAIQQAVVPQLIEQRDQNRAALALLVGRAPEHVEVRGGNIWKLDVPQVPPGLPSALLVQRPDIREAEQKLKAAGADVEAAHAAFLPTIALTGDRGVASVALATLFGPGAGIYTVAANITQPIFDGGQLLGQLELKQAVREEFLVAYRQAVLSGLTDVEKALVAVQQSREQERRQREAVAQSKRAYELSEERLRLGAIDLTTLISTEQIFFQQEDVLAQDRRARLEAIVRLIQALGGGWLGPQPADRRISGVYNVVPRISTLPLDKAIFDGQSPRPPPNATSQAARFVTQ